MALQNEELFGDAVEQKPLKRAKPHADGISVGTLAELAAPVDLPHLTPLFFDSSLGTAGQWDVWSANGVSADDPIDGFLWVPGSEDHAGLDSGETLIQVFKRGLIHAADVPLPAGESQPDLDAALRDPDLRQKGITVQGLEAIP